MRLDPLTFTTLFAFLLPLAPVNASEVYPDLSSFSGWSETLPTELRITAFNLAAGESLYLVGNPAGTAIGGTNALIAGNLYLSGGPVNFFYETFSVTGNIFVANSLGIYSPTEFVYDPLLRNPFDGNFSHFTLSQPIDSGPPIWIPDLYDYVLPILIPDDLQLHPLVSTVPLPAAAWLLLGALPVLARRRA